MRAILRIYRVEPANSFHQYPANSLAKKNQILQRLEKLFRVQYINAFFRISCSGSLFGFLVPSWVVVLNLGLWVKFLTDNLINNTIKHSLHPEAEGTEIS